MSQNKSSIRIWGCGKEKSIMLGPPCFVFNNRDKSTTLLAMSNYMIYHSLIIFFSVVSFQMLNLGHILTCNIIIICFFTHHYLFVFFSAHCKTLSTLHLQYKTRLVPVEHFFVECLMVSIARIACRIISVPAAVSKGWCHSDQEAWE